MISEFHDVIFPLRVAFGSTMARERKVEVVALASGREQRNARLMHSRRTYDAGSGVRSIQDLRVVMDFFEARRGPLTSFRFRDALDNSSRHDALSPTPLDEVIGTGDGVKVRFPLVKRYGSGVEAYARPIKRPIAATARVAVAGVEALATNFSVDASTGEVVFTPSKSPANGASVTAGFLFHVEVRFASDRISANLTAFDAGEVPSIPLIEVFT